MKIAPVKAMECAPLRENLPTALKDSKPHTMEQYDQGYRMYYCIARPWPAGPEATLEASAVHDIGQVFVNGKRIRDVG